MECHGNRAFALMAYAFDAAVVYVNLLHTARRLQLFGPQERLWKNMQKDANGMA